MIEAPFALAFTAGLVATVNPCGFAMLPAYLGYYIGLEDDAGEARPDAVGRALLVGGVVSSGFLLVFGVTGALITLGLRTVIDALPWAAMVIGVGVAVLGVVMLTGRELLVRLPKVSRVPGGRRYATMFVFGLSYAVASLSCTLPVFLVVVAGAVPNTSLFGGILLFVVYGLGMSLVLVAVTLAIALGRHGLLARLRRSTAWVNRIAGGILVLAGVYITWFWATNLNDPLAASGPITVVEGWSSQLTQAIGDRPLGWGVLLASCTLAAVVYRLATRRRPRPAGRGREESPQRRQG